ncbi:hypothetical protein JQV27_01360 [Sulfitobacter mediterraneus]|uniref:DUF6476 family protein n=1 Tax=Sulfitobacter TaxID=60136 RepID=UPI0019323BB7|nr:MULTISPECIES: DUF6476 family protein [Sulfitobacter]MBM1631469.1 hypothetical protein [Sulfitobacter mediterraneus]MBM1639284.1 hypothetical protein [Sulfitobacter mediterraneus]MBM1643333.1 hypothetical protein [Sulfitobacter mediterraneus]MBM1647379.1 hypothetical protein [Sulfitobacter mediterraneus]MBM1651424.1 hypothetical protein [Sulfitobacter mediterraneus]
MDDPIEPANLRFLRRLVTVLTTVMICGVLVVIGLLVTRLNRNSPILPQEIALPEGASAVAFTQGPDWYAIVTNRDEILIYDRLTGTLRQTVTITP